MTLKDDETGVTVELVFDGEGFPQVIIDLGGNFYDENFRPSVEVKLNDVVVHQMFDHSGTDRRWADPEDGETSPEQFLAKVVSDFVLNGDLYHTETLSELLRSHGFIEAAERLADRPQ